MTNHRGTVFQGFFTNRHLVFKFLWLPKNNIGGKKIEEKMTVPKGKNENESAATLKEETQQHTK